MGSHGYNEWVFGLTNTSKESPHTVTLTLPARSYAIGGDQIREITRTVEVKPSQTVRVSLLQPCLPALAGDGLAVAVDGRTQEEPIRLTFAPSTRGLVSSPYGSGGPLLVLVSNRMKEDLLRGGLPAFPPPGMPGGSAGTRQIIRSNVPVTAWGTDWLGYSRYDGILVTSGELRDMPAGVRDAVWRYVEAGGSLSVVGDADVPEGWKRRRSIHGGLTVYQAGFGQYLTSTDPTFPQERGEGWSLLNASWGQTAAPWQKVRSVEDANAAFKVVDDVGIPVRGLFLLMLVFAVVIGPVNFTLLARKRRRMWLLWTVPTISLVTILAVFGYMLLLEGWSGHLRTEALTILDETSHRAATIGWMAFYTPVTPGDGLHFDYDTEVTPQIGSDMYRGRISGGPHDIDWTSDQHLTRGWVSARIPAHFKLRKCAVRRERVTVGPGPDGALTAANGLGAEVSRLHYADEQGRVYRAGPIPAGARAVLAATGETLPADREWEEARALYAGDWVGLVASAARTPTRLLGPRCYLAELDSAPFVEEGLRNVKTRACRSVVLGILREAGHED
jgi:hypothetical protein